MAKNTSRAFNIDSDIIALFWEKCWVTFAKMTPIQSYKYSPYISYQRSDLLL